MINLNEFRIGNLANLIETNTTVSITGVSSHVLSCRIGVYIPEKFEYIKITEKWILMAEVKYYMFLEKHWRFEFKSKNRGLAFYIGNEYIRDLRYLHEFQNFYFSLTGEELVFSSTEP